MNICPVCRNVNQRDATVCRYCRTALTPPSPSDAVAPVAARRRRWPWFAGLAALVLVVGLGSLTLFGGGGAAAQGASVVVGTGEGASLEFEPKTVPAPAQSQVTLTFNNVSTLPHNLTFQETITEKTDPDVPAGASDTITFTTPGPGSYKFVCTIHPGMEGQLTVQ